MKRYLVFQYDGYEAIGGFYDLRGSFDSIAECEASITCEYWHVIDRDTLECVAGNSAIWPNSNT